MSSVFASVLQSNGGQSPEWWTWPNWFMIFASYFIVLGGVVLPLLLTAAVVVTSPIWLTVMIVQLACDYRLRRSGRIIGGPQYPRTRTSSLRM